MGLSKEEKKAKKEAKRLEKLRQEAEIKKKLRRDELSREMAAQAAKKSELDKNWREMMLKIKEPVFKQDVEVLWHTFERAYDKKDFLISHTLNLIDTADDQFQRAIASFCDTIDTTINKFLADLEAMSKENDERTAALLKLNADITDKIKTDHNAAELHLQLLLFHGHTASDNYIWTTRGENLVKEDEERSKYLDERENLRSFLENYYNSMWEEYKAVLKAYVTGTADNQKQMRKLRRKETIMSDIIASQAKKIASSDETLRRLRIELAAYESGTKQAVFRDRRQRHRVAWFRMKQCLLQGIATDQSKLAFLVKTSDTTAEWLEAAFKIGEKILKIAALCRKFETRREKVLPFGCDEPHSPVKDERKSNVRRQQSDDSLVANAIATTCGLTRLWQRIAKAELSKRALARERMMLEQENSLLEQSIQKYGTRQISGPNGKNCLCDKKKKKLQAYHPVAVEGALEIAKYEKH